MLHRLFIALLTACLALPALAMPAVNAVHAAPSTIAALDVHAMSGPSHAAGEHAMRGGGTLPCNGTMGHDCIGCMARFDGIAPADTVIAPPAPRPAAQPSARFAHSPAAPDTPPPRA